MTKTELVNTTAEFVNEKVRENLTHTSFEQMFIIDIQAFLKELIDNECRLNEKDRETMFISVLEEIECGNAPIICDDYNITDVSEDGEITFTQTNRNFSEVVTPYRTISAAKPLNCPVCNDTMVFNAIDANFSLLNGHKLITFKCPKCDSVLTFKFDEIKK